MEPFVDELRKFEAIHQWWSPQTFQRLENKTLTEFTRAKLADLSTLSPLLQSGSVEEFETWIAAILEAAPKMITVVLACCLDRLHQMDYAQDAISQSIVAWYRKEGWSFPPFHHEQGQKIDDDWNGRTATQPEDDA